MEMFKMTIRLGNVRFWNVYSQTWQTMRAADLVAADQLMATFSEYDRMRVHRAANR